MVLLDWSRTHLNFGANVDTDATVNVALAIKVFFPSVNANVDASVSADAMCEYTLVG